MSWDKFSKGASLGFDKFIDVVKGKNISDAMKEIKDELDNYEEEEED